MCYDDFPTIADLNIHAIQTAQKEGNLLYTGLCCLATLSGYQISSLFDRLESVCLVSDAIDSIKNGFTIERDGKRVSLSIEEMNAFENHICSIVDNELQFLFKLNGGCNNG